MCYHNCVCNTTRLRSSSSKQHLPYQSKENRDVLGECMTQSLLLMRQTIVTFARFKTNRNYFSMKNIFFVKFQTVS